MGLVVAMAGLGVAVLVSAGGCAAEGAGERQTVTTETAARPGIPLWGARAVLIVAGLGGWFWTQSLIGRRAWPADGIGDGLHQLSAPLHRFLVEHPRWTEGLLIVTSGLIDLLGLFLLASALFGPSIRPFVGLLVLFALRQLCQGLCALPPPEGMLWRQPGVPSLLVTYGVANDLFFSGHTAIAVYGAVELARAGGPGLALVGVTIAAIEAATVIVLRAHYTMDVFAGAVTALLAAGLASELAPACDRVLTIVAHAFGR
jgi:hypothetical protein